MARARKRQRQAGSDSGSVATATAAVAGEDDLTFRRVTQPLPDGRVRVRLDVWCAGRQLGRIVPSGAGSWQWQPAREVAGRAPRRWYAGVEEAKEEVRKALQSAQQ